MQIEFRSPDLKILRAKLGRKEGTVGAQASRALRKTAYDIERDAKTIAPVDTGALRGSISTDLTGDGRHGSMSAEIGPTVEYGHFVERGTSRQAPQPYMGPAAERRVPQLEAALRRIGGDVL